MDRHVPNCEKLLLLFQLSGPVYKTLVWATFYLLHPFQRQMQLLRWLKRQPIFNSPWAKVYFGHVHRGVREFHFTTPLFHLDIWHSDFKFFEANALMISWGAQRPGTMIWQSFSKNYEETFEYNFGPNLGTKYRGIREEFYEKLSEVLEQAHSLPGTTIAEC